jgi:hypothetical protein
MIEGDRYQFRHLPRRQNREKIPWVEDSVFLQDTYIGENVTLKKYDYRQKRGHQRQGDIKRP